MGNTAFIDGQNLYMGTKLSDFPWKINLFKFRIYLKEKYNVLNAYYFIGFFQEENRDLYEDIQKAGYILNFKQHNPLMVGKKKGNIDSDLIFTVMKKLYKREISNQVVLVSGDGDYKLLVDFLIEEKRFKKILFPNRKFASSLYKSLRTHYFDYLDTKEIRNKILKKEKGSLGN